MTVSIRPLRIDDAAGLAALYRANRAYLAPFEPVRTDRFFTEDGQREQIEAALGSPRELRYLVEVDAEVAGRVNVTNVVLGASCSGSLGYWIDRSHTGRGVATEAVRQVIDECFGRHGLHRLEASTLVDNAGSQKVLERNGFCRIGLAPRYLRIAGEWRDHLLFQRLAD